jgi:hypothetical protein
VPGHDNGHGGRSVTNRTCATPRCDHPSPDGFVCSVCIDALHRDLRALAGRRPDDPVGPVDADDQIAAAVDHGLIAELVTTMARLDVHEPDSADPVPWDSHDDCGDDDAAAPDARRAGLTFRLPYRIPAAETLRNLHAELTTWVRHLIEQRFGPDLDGFRRDRAYRAGGGTHGPWRRRPSLPANDPRELALFLDRYREAIRQDEAGGELVAAIARHTIRAKLVIFPRAGEYMGTCSCPPLCCTADHDDPAVALELGTEARCKAGRPHWLQPVDLYIPAGDAVVTCPRCGSHWDTEERREWLLERCRDQLVTAADASRALVEFAKRHLPPGRSFTASAIRGYGHRGRLTTFAGRGEDDADAERDDARLYQVGELMDLVVTIGKEDAARKARRSLPEQRKQSA